VAGMSLFDRFVVAALPLVPRQLVGRFGRPYIAGARAADAVALVRSLNADGMSATLDFLGENIRRLEDADVPRNAYLNLLAEIQRQGLDANVSIKLTQMGLKMDAEACYRNLRSVVARAAELGIFVRLDMEDSSCTDETLAAYRRLRSEFFTNTGVVLQAMLRRTAHDADELAAEGARVRLCKGIYVEPAKAAWQGRETVRHNYAFVLERLLRAGCHVGIATHDERLVWEGVRLVHELGLSRDQYEFQMLLGVAEELRGILVSEGHPLRVYVPFGDQWYAYSIRRLRENPRLAGTMARSTLGLGIGAETA
jgi:proline dehydrogenase